MKLFALWFIRIAIVLVAIFVIMGIPAYFFNSKEMPSAEKAPWAVQAYIGGVPSRIYYAESRSILGDDWAITNYWSYDGENYHRHKETYVFDSEDWSKVVFIARR